MRLVTKQTCCQTWPASRDIKRPLRAMLADLQAIDPVRLIESAGN